MLELGVAWFVVIRLKIYFQTKCYLHLIVANILVEISGCSNLPISFFFVAKSYAPAKKKQITNSAGFFFIHCLSLQLPFFIVFFFFFSAELTKR